METSTLLIAIASMGGLGLLFSTGLSLAEKKFYVEEDPRVTKIIDELPGVNCGGCGQPGCAKFAEALVASDAEPNGCPVSGDDARIAIGEILGITGSSPRPRVSRPFV